MSLVPSVLQLPIDLLLKICVYVDFNSGVIVTDMSPHVINVIHIFSVFLIDFQLGEALRLSALSFYNIKQQINL